MKKIFRFLFRPYWKILLWMMAAFSIWYLTLPLELFSDPYSTVIEDRYGNLLGARIAADGQWRFPPMDTVPEKFAQAAITFEDQHFLEHPGVNLGAIWRAGVQNLRSRRLVSGGSTITMQVVKMAAGRNKRTVQRKLMEAILAIRLERKFSKREILALWASHAPFGGNVVGLDAAAWRYYGRRADQLSWAESATLAVLPNAPALIHPGRNRDALKAKRDRLLDRLYRSESLDSITCELAKTEPLPQAPIDLPNEAPHLLDRVKKEHGEGSRTQTTIDVHLQNRTEAILSRHQRSLRENGIHNAAAIVLDVATGDVLVYQGNVSDAGFEHGNQVDLIRARRSTGSILKPFLYASMLSDGEILPNTLVADIPTYYGSYSPKNYNRTYDGAVPAKKALARSLNIPATRMLHQYGHQRFYYKLKDLGMKTLTQHPDHYGLSLILGGSEASLWDLSGMYASMARTVNNFQEFDGRYDQKGFRAPNYLRQASTLSGYKPELKNEAVLSASACYLTLEAMLDVTRPAAEQNWQAFSSSRRIAWKTGTSYGYRDAWAIGCTPERVVAVWVGNADGEGRPGLVGLHAAAPILFDIFDAIQGPNLWFDAPHDDLVEVQVCKHSGHRASSICDASIAMQIPQQGLNTSPCPYHQLVHLDPTEQYRLHSDCASPSEMVHKPWFVLPPAQADLYKRHHVNYRNLPPWRGDCEAVADAENQSSEMEFIYPRNASQVYVPVGLDGELSSVVFEVAHRQDAVEVHWHLDQEFLGTTKDFHQLALAPGPGEHVLTLVDAKGNTLRKRFEVIGKGG